MGKTCPLMARNGCNYENCENNKFQQILRKFDHLISQDPLTRNYKNCDNYEKFIIQSVKTPSNEITKIAITMRNLSFNQSKPP